jgi:undecaprenyl diphosphate synthase
VTLEESKEDEERMKESSNEMLIKRNKIVMSLLEAQVKLDLPVLTLYLLSSSTKSAEYLTRVTASITELLEGLAKAELIHNNQVKVSVLGKWYDLPGGLVDAVKSVVDATASYDRFFLNLCVNYNGQEEIVDACKLLARRVKAEREDPDRLTTAAIKESLYSSSIIPPQLIIKNGEKTLPNVLLWDSPGARIYFTGKHWSEFGKSDFLKALSS